MSTSLRKRYVDLETMVKDHDFTKSNNVELVEMQVDLLSDLQSELNDKQLSLDELRSLREQTARISNLLTEKVKSERKQRKEKEDKDKKKVSK